MSLLLTLGLGGTATPTPTTGGDTPYMNLLLPTVSVTLGPLYASEVNQAFLRVDQHDHSSGYGKLVGTNGLNINADLAFHGFKATNLDAAGFNIRSHTSGLTGSVYMSGQDLYCQDGAGNVIQITAAGAVNVAGLGSWTGLTAPAQASYNSVTKKFSLRSNTTGPLFGLLEVGDIFLFPGDPNSGTLPYIRLATPTGGVVSYTWQFPPAVPAGAGNKKLTMLNNDGTVTLYPASLPAATSFLRMDSTGSVASDVVLDGSTLQIASGQLRVSPGGIGTTQLANTAVTADKLQTLPSTTQVVYSGTHVNNVTTSPVTLTIQPSAVYPGKNARPIMLVFGPAQNTTSNFRVFGAGNPIMTFTISMDGNSTGAGTCAWLMECWQDSAARNYSPWTTFIIPPNSILSGTHQWALTFSNNTSDCSPTFAFSVQEL